MMSDHGEFSTNLTLDGVREGAYMLSKHSDDLLGHHARQVFREKAASRRAENSIYYYLKDLMKQFGLQQHAFKVKKLVHGEPQQLVLESHEFRKLVASDPAFESAIPSDHVDALFHRLEGDYQNLVLHRDFVEFCLLDHDQLRLLLYKYRNHLKSLQLSDNEIAETFKRLSPPEGSAMASELFHAAIMRDLDVVLTTGELAFVMNLMDSDKDGMVKLQDLERLIKDENSAEELVKPPRVHGIVDIKLSVDSAEETRLRKESYIQLFPKLHGESSSNPSMYLWFQTAERKDGKSTISNIMYAASSRDTDLVSKGFTCLQQDINRNGVFGKNKYIWTSLIPSSTQMANELIDLSLSSGDLSDKNTARLWLPLHRGFKLVPGNLNEKSSKHGVFLWLRRRRASSTQDLIEPSRIKLVTTSPRTGANVHRHIDDLEDQVRIMLRRNCPIDQDCSLNFNRLFEEFDPKKVRAITKQAVLAGIESFGIIMDKKDFRLVWKRINPFGIKLLDVDAFAQFLELTDFEIDELVNALQRMMTTRFDSHVPNYRLIFQSYNTLGDGKLSRSDFQRLFATNQLKFTNGELSKVIQRFDVNRDGIVDYSDFLSYITGICDASSRVAGRIAEAADEFRTWALERQNKLLTKNGSIDSVSAWRILKPKNGRLDSEVINHILRQRRKRLNAEQIYLLQVLMAPATNGEVNQAAFHAFVNHVPKKITTVIYDLKKLVGSGPIKSDTDDIFNRLNSESNGKLSLVKFSQQLNALAVENLARQVDLKDLAYVVQYAGANCGGNGAVLIDRFLTVIRGNPDRRNMKSEFLTHYDSPRFIEGVNLLRDELKRCAKTLDGKFDYMIPFQLFDKDHSGEVDLSEFEAAIRELGVNKYLTDQEIKGLMRRFDANSSGAITFDEFLRFNLVESSSSSSRRLNIVIAPDPILQSILKRIIANERLTPDTVGAFCGSIKRMFGIIDKESTGLILATRFVETLQEMSVAVPNADIDILVKEFGGDDAANQHVQYQLFCDALAKTCREGSEVQNIRDSSLLEVLGLLNTLRREFDLAQRKLEANGDDLDVDRAFGIEKDATECVLLSVDDFKDVLWAVGVHHPFLREELEILISCFQPHPNSGLNVHLFRKFLSKGPSAFLAGNSRVFDKHIKRFADKFLTFQQTKMGAGGRLFTIFSELDADTISREEFLQLLQRAGLKKYLGPEDENLLLQFLATNDDSIVSYTEFIAFVQHVDEKTESVVGTQCSTQTASPANGVVVDEAPESLPLAPQDSSSLPTVDSSAKKDLTDSVEVEKRPHIPVLNQIGKLNALLRPQFPFAKYFRKYHAKQKEEKVKVRVFAKVVDKFLDRLVMQRVLYNMKDMNIEVLEQAYAMDSDEGKLINYKLFLDDLSNAQKNAADSDSSSSSDSDAELSCSSDEEEQTVGKVSKVIETILLQAVKHMHKTPAELHALKSLVSSLNDDFKAKMLEAISEKKVYKLLTTLSLRICNKDVSTLLSHFKTERYDRDLYDVRSILAEIEGQVDVAIRSQEQPSAASFALPVEVKPISPPAVAPTLDPVLARKIYKCFRAAAQHNISGRKLLEKCDVAKNGKLTLLEFQTVLRLMGCSLSTAELEAVKAALGDVNSAQINYSILVEQIGPDHHSRSRNLRSSSPVRRHCKDTFDFPDKLQFSNQEASPLAANHSYRSKAPCQQEVAPRAHYPFDEVKRIDRFVAHFFSDLLNIRQVGVLNLHQSFEPYDIKSTGFISLDAFDAVMRKLDIHVPADIASTVIARFSASSREKFDYVDFCQVVSALLPPKSPLAHGCPVSRVVEDVSPHYGADAARAGVQPRIRTTRIAPVDKIIGAAGHKLRQDERAEVFKLNTPVLDHDFKTKEPIPHVRNSVNVGKKEIRGWKCSVCFHQQTRPTTTCEICAAQDPASVNFRSLLQCLACGYRNYPDAQTCELCTVSLRRSMPTSENGSKFSPTKPYAVPLPRVDPNDGWLA